MEHKKMLVEEIEELGKELHKVAETFEASCKIGDGFQAHFAIGILYNLMPSLRAMGKRCHEMNQPDIPKDEYYLEEQMDNRGIKHYVIRERLGEAQEDGT